MIEASIEESQKPYIPTDVEADDDNGVIEIAQWTAQRALYRWCQWDCAGDVKGSVFPARHSNQTTDGQPDTRVALFVAREVERFAGGSMRLCPIRDMIRYRVWMKHRDWTAFRWTENIDHECIMRRVMAWQGETLSDLADRVWHDLTKFLEKQMQSRGRIP